MGFQHGRKARDQIRHNLAVYFRRFKNETELSRDIVLKRAARYVSVITRLSPEYAETMRGVADGADSDLLDITALNVRYELMYSQFSKIGLRPIPRTYGCTAFAALPATVKNGHLIMGQNWDWIPEVECLFLKMRSRATPNVLSFTEAGVVGGKIGLNSDGLGLLINGMISNKDDWSKLRKPFHVRCWEVLRSRTLRQAVSAITRGERNCSANFLLGQQTKNGQAEIVDIESAPGATCKLRPDRGAIGHTNHFSDPSVLSVEQVLDEERLSTVHRYKMIQELLDQRVRNRSEFDVEKAQEMLRDHDGRPESVCRHSNAAFPEDERYETVVSVIMDLQARKLWATLGTPCASPYRTLTLN